MTRTVRKKLGFSLPFFSPIGMDNHNINYTKSNPNTNHDMGHLKPNPNITERFSLHCVETGSNRCSFLEVQILGWQPDFPGSWRRSTFSFSIIKILLLKLLIVIWWQPLPNYSKQREETVVCPSSHCHWHRHYDDDDDDSLHTSPKHFRFDSNVYCGTIIIIIIIIKSEQPHLSKMLHPGPSPHPPRALHNCPASPGV